MSALTIHGLHKTYGSDVHALKGIDIDVKEGDFFGLLGPNGAGKTTIIGIITGLVDKTSGSVRVYDINIDEHFNDAKRLIGVVPQEINFSVFDKVIDIIISQAGYYGIPQSQAYPVAEKYLKLLELWDKKDAQARSLSGGMKRRLMIVRALIHKPKLLLLDEPTAGVDVELRREMWDIIKKINKEGTTIILTTHYLEEAEEMCNNIAIIDKGTIIENASKKELLRKRHQETFVFDLKRPLKTLPFNSFDVKKIDDHTIEVVISGDHTLNALFKEFEKHKLEILSMRNKKNRLEELFLELVNS